MAEGAQKAHHVYADADADVVGHIVVDIEIGAYCHNSSGNDCANMRPNSPGDKPGS